MGRTKSAHSVGSKKTSCLCLRRLSTAIVWGLESFFYRLGKLVARNPIRTITACLLICGLCGIGLKEWHEENEYVKVWLPRTSRMVEEHSWVQRKFPKAMRVTSLIVESSNVLTPEALNAMLNLFLEADKFRMQGRRLDSICVKAGTSCRVQSILELWKYNVSAIRSLSSDDIVTMVNAGIKYSPMYGTEIDLSQILGGISRNTAGDIVAAEATTMLWLLEKNEETKQMAEDWELQMINKINKHPYPEVRKMYIYTQRTFKDEAVGALTEDLVLLSAGFGLVLFYVIICISNYSSVEHKIYIAIAGVFSIALAICFTYGLGFWTGIMFGPIHQIMPFMLLGIGVDDMFVVLEALKHLSPEEKRLGVEERIGLTLKKAGVSITVTSVTDIVAFGIGGSTVIPSLSTFCIYAAIGVFALYVLQATYFVACLSLDQRRISDRRDACCMCFKLRDDYKPNKHHDYSILHEIMARRLGPLLTEGAVKFVVILAALGLVGVNIWSVTKLKPDFDFALYLPPDSYSTEFVLADRRLFPDDGTYAVVYCDKVDVYRSHAQLETMFEAITNRPDVQSSTVDFWLPVFRRWLRVAAVDTQVALKLRNDYFPKTNQGFYDLFIQFLNTGNGRAYRRFLKLDNDTAPRAVEATAFSFRHTKFEKSTAAIESMDAVRNVVDGYNFPFDGKCFVYGDRAYMFSETNKVLNLELYRNLALAAVSVFVVTLFLIANLWTSILVFFCVAFTVVDVAGSLQFWGVTIDTASSVLLILCFGLAVDYSAHIGHTFMTINGEKNDRAKRTLIEIGPAVFNGGFSTFLAFILLVKSKSYGFMLFFRTFTLVVVLGLFHGLIVLPVVLSLIGPSPYNTYTTGDDQEQSTQKKVVLLTPPYLKKSVVNEDGKFKFSNGAFENDANSDRLQFNGFRDTCTAQFKRRESNQSHYEQMSNGSLVLIPPIDYTPPSPRRYLPDVPR